MKMVGEALAITRRENSENLEKLKSLHRVNLDETIGTLDGCEDLLLENERLRDKFQKATVESNRRYGQRVRDIEAKVKEQLENEAHYLTFRYSSDRQSL